MRRNVILGLPTQSLRRALLCGVLTFSGASAANAQSSTNCVTMGSGMMHCDTMDMSPPTFNPGAQQQADSNSGALLGLAIRGMRERSLNSKIGKMVASGDCQAALDYALTKGRFDIAEQVKGMCRR